MANPAPALLLDLEAWQKLFGWETEGKLVNIEAEINSETLDFTMKMNPEQIQMMNGKGPLQQYRIGETVTIDPRKKYPQQ
jgi:hypothetical protein